MNAIKNICIGDYSRLKKPVLSTMLSHLVNIVPFAFSIEAINVIFRYFCKMDSQLNTTRLWQIFFIMLFYMVIMAWAERRASRANFKGAYNMSANGRINLVEHIRRLPLGFLSKHDPADISSMLITDFNMAEIGISHYLPQLLGALIMPVLAFLGLVWIDWRMATAMFISLPVSMLIMFVVSKVQNILAHKHISAKVNAAARVEEYLQGIRVIKAYNLEGEKFDRLKQAFLSLKKAAVKDEAILGPLVLLTVAIIRSGLTFMIITGAYLIVKGKLDVLTFVMFLIIGSRVFDPLTNALTRFIELRFYSIAGGRILSLMNEKEQQTVPIDDKTTTQQTDNIIEFRNVSFAYTDKMVLKDVNICIKPNTLTALVGKSGSGKSTIIKLITRFYDVQKGKILFNNVPINSITEEDLLKHISVVFQDVYLFKDTVKNNLLLGKQNASNEEIIRAAKLANAHDFIMQLPNGYDTLIGEGGNTLSGGEKQRISIARAMLKDADIILLDEATASLDAENEVEVQRAINNLIKNKTVIVIAHRLTTTVNSDNIIVMNEGNVVEQGKHEDLLQNNGLYKKLWDLQNI